MVKIATKSLALFVCALFAFALLSCGGGGGGGGGSASSGPWGGKTTITIPFTKGGTSRAGFSKGFNDLNWDAIELTVTQIANGKSEVVYEDMITAEKNITVEVVTGSRIEATAIIKMKGDESDRTATGVIEKVEPGKNTLTVYVPYKCTLLNEDNEVVDVILYNARDGLVLQNLSDDELLVSKYTDLETDVEYNVGTVTGINGDKRFRLSTAEKYPFLLGNSGDGYIVNTFTTGRDETVIKIPATINGTPVIGIADNAFKNCTQITKVELPEGLRTIGNYAFDGCSNLTTINLPNSITEIYERAFNKCSSLKTITLPTKLTTLGKDAFTDCTALEGTITIPSGVTVLIEGLFSGCHKLEGVILHDGITEIDDFSLRECRSIKSLTVPDSVTVLGDYGHIFQGCISLETITLPEVTTLLMYTFDGCTALREINIPKVTKLDKSSFYGCNNLQKITFGTDNPPTLTFRGPVNSDLTGVEIHIPSSVDVDKNAWVDRFNSYFGTTLLDIIKDQ